ncbi:hypothetical protein ACFX1Z_018736 [Malus domestica]
MPPVSKSLPRCPSRAKSGSHLKRLATMKSNKVNSVAKLAPKPISFVVETDSPYEKDETAHMGTTKPVSGEAAKICALLKPNLLEDIDACAKLVDDVRGVICPSSFAKHATKYRKTVMLTMM